MSREVLFKTLRSRMSYVVAEKVNSDIKKEYFKS